MDGLSVLARQRRPWHGGANLMVGGVLLRLAAPALVAILALSGCETLLGLNDLADQTGGPSDGALDATGAAGNVPEATPPDGTYEDAALSPQPYAEGAPPEADAVTEDATEAQAQTVDGSGRRA